MKVSQAKDSQTFSVGSLESTNMGISDSSLLFYMLGESLYKNPTEAAIREIVTNAYDAHIENGVKEPVKITVDPNDITITDCGGGIPHDEFLSVYGVLGFSTKRDKSNQTGGMGIGKLAPLTTAASFIVENTYKGETCIYTITRGSVETNGAPSVTLLTTLPAIREDGLSVIIPRETFESRKDERLVAILSSLAALGNMHLDMKFYDKSDVLLDSFTHEPVDMGEEGMFLVSSLPFIGYVQRISSLPKARIIIKYGNNFYPISTVDFPCRPELISSLVSSNLLLVINAKANTLQFTPNREELLESDSNRDTRKRLAYRANHFYLRDRKKLQATTNTMYKKHLYMDVDNASNIIIQIANHYQSGTTPRVQRVQAGLRTFHRRNIRVTPWKEAVSSGLFFDAEPDYYELAREHFDHEKGFMAAKVMRNKAEYSYFLASFIHELREESRFYQKYLRLIAKYRISRNTLFSGAGGTDKELTVLFSSKFIIVNNPGLLKDTLSNSTHDPSTAYLFVPKRVDIDSFAKDLKNLTRSEVEVIKHEAEPSNKKTPTRNMVKGYPIKGIVESGLENVPSVNRFKYFSNDLYLARNLNKASKLLSPKVFKRFINEILKSGIGKSFDIWYNHSVYINGQDIGTVQKRKNPPSQVSLDLSSTSISTVVGLHIVKDGTKNKEEMVNFFTCRHLLDEVSNILAVASDMGIEHKAVIGGKYSLYPLLQRIYQTNNDEPLPFTPSRLLKMVKLWEELEVAVGTTHIWHLCMHKQALPNYASDVLGLTTEQVRMLRSIDVSFNMDTLERNLLIALRLCGNPVITKISNELLGE